MKKSKAIKLCRRCVILFVSGGILLFATSLRVNGQELPPRPIIVTVSVVQNLSFGAFYHYNAGGTVIIFPDGSRSNTGDVVLINLGYSFSTGLYDIVGNRGTLITILNGPDAILTGSSGGTLTLEIGASDPVSPFILTTVPPAATQLRIGGTLIVGNPLANPPGNYSGTFEITLVQQ